MTKTDQKLQNESLLLAEDDEFDIEKIDLDTAKKVLAPFLKIPKRQTRTSSTAECIVEELTNYYSQDKPKEVLAKLTSSFRDSLKLPTMLNETAELLKAVTSSKGVNLYLTNYEQTEIMLCPKFIQKTDRNETKYKIGNNENLLFFEGQIFKNYIYRSWNNLGSLCCLYKRICHVK